jgi:hypothetical protein
MLLKDNVSHGSRAPYEIAKRYWSDDPITMILKSSLDSYLPYRIQFNVHLCINRIFKLSSSLSSSSSSSSSSSDTTNDTRKKQILMTPFIEVDRKIAGLTPRTWFVASVIGYTMSREMNNLALHIISYMGHGAKKTMIGNKRSKSTKKRRSTMTTKAAATIKRKGRGIGNNGNRNGNEETNVSNNEESSKMMRTRSSNKKKI